MEIKESDFNKTVRALETRREKTEKRLLEAISGYYDMKMMNIPPGILNKPINKLTKSDISYLAALQSDGSKKNPREENNVISEAEPPPKFRKPSTRSSRMEKFKTPARTIKTPMSVMVTPKFNPHSTMSVLRKPKEGEIAMSICGSPLHVTSVINESKPNVVVPLENGKILSVLPERGLRKSEIPTIDPVLRRQLKLLNENLTAILSMNE